MERLEGVKIKSMIPLGTKMFQGLKTDLAMVAQDMGLSVDDGIYFVEIGDDKRPTGEAMTLGVVSAVGQPGKESKAGSQSLKFELIHERHKQVHDLKSWPPYYRAQAGGIKPFEIRKADRDIQPGDDLVLHEFTPTLKNVIALYPNGLPASLGFKPIEDSVDGVYSGSVCTVRVLSVWNADEIVGLGASEGVFVIGTRRIEPEEARI